MLFATVVHTVSAHAIGFGGHADGQLDAIPISKLPAARETLRLIDTGGPFRYGNDGTVFGNRELRLPRRPRGYYHEYTVPTLGSRGRGARRIITGRDGEAYYTDDHYRSFKRILK